MMLWVNDFKGDENHSSSSDLVLLGGRQRMFLSLAYSLLQHEVQCRQR